MARVSTEQRRRELTAAAIRVLVADGPGAVTARRVADEAGAPLGTVHYAFRDMDEVLQLAAAEVLSAATQALGDVRINLGVREAIGDILHGYWRWIRDGEELALAFAETLVALLRPGTATATVVEAERTLLSLLCDAENSDPQPSRLPLDRLASLTLMAIDGLTIIYLGRRDRERTEDDVEHLIAALQSLV